MQDRKRARASAWVGALAAAILLVAPGAPALAEEDPAWPDIRSDYREGNFRSALGRLERLVATHPQDREAHYYLALIQWRLENYPAAAASWRRVMELDPNGPFGKDAQLWLATYGDLAITAPRPSATPAGSTPSPTPPVLPTPSVVATPASTPRPRATATPPPRTPWLQAQPEKDGGPARSRNARPGYFKALDGTFEFVPPGGFVLLDEGVDGSERRALFGPVATLQVVGGSEQPPTLLIVWRDMPELKRYRTDQKAARARQLLTIEAATYGPGAKLEARFGVPAMRVSQRQGGWAADTWLFFQHDRLYAVTYGGEADQLPKFATAVSRSLTTPIFYP